MDAPPKEIFQYWKHAFEDDEGEITTWRPASHDFPRARGRRGIEFREDGVFIDRRITRSDTASAVCGTWQMLSSGEIRVSLDHPSPDVRTYDIAFCDESLLKLRIKEQSR